MLLGLYGIDGSEMNHEQIQGLTIVLDNRGYWSEVNLDRYHTDILVSGYEVKYRAAIVKRWHELEEAARKGNVYVYSLNLDILCPGINFVILLYGHPELLNIIAPIAACYVKDFEEAAGSFLKSWDSVTNSLK